MNTSTETRTRVAASSRRPAALCAASAAALLAASMWLPLWQMKLEAPQYPDGLELVAYGDRIAGDLAEVNIINHYIGMAEIAERPVVEMRLYRYAMGLLALSALVGIASRALSWLVLFGVAAMPLAVLVDLQYWLYRYGHDLDPSAPLRFVEPFTPLVIGISRIGNFRSFSMVSWGFLAWVLAALLLGAALRYPWRHSAAAERRSAVATRATAMLVGVVTLLSVVLGQPDRLGAEALAGVPVGARPASELQERIDAAAPGALVEVRGGSYLGAIRVRGPLRLVGLEEPVLDGAGAGSVVSIEGDGVVFEGFVVRGSGREISREPAGIRVTGSHHVIERNRIEDVYFGIHLSDGEGNVVRGNVIRPASSPQDRPGHGISLWYQRQALVEGNRIEHARDGVYLSFSDDLLVARNHVSSSRYGVHSMSSQRSVIEGNELTGNLLGAALMSSEGLALRCNRIAGHREGATAYAILLKDMADVRVEGNVLAGNRVAIYADNTPLGARGEALVAGNHLVGNGAALALQSTARLTVVENLFLDNLSAIRLEGRQLASDTVWAQGGRGNFWDDYRGVDRNRDGVGDWPYRHVLALPALLRADEPARSLVYTPAHQLVEAAARLFPVIRTLPAIDDPAPLMRQPALPCPVEAPG